MNSPSPTVSTTTIVVELENGVVHTFKKIFEKPGFYWESTDPNLNYRKGKVLDMIQIKVGKQLIFVIEAVNGYSYFTASEEIVTKAFLKWYYKTQSQKDLSYAYIFNMCRIT